MPKVGPKRKAANGYKLAERLPKGEILEDIGKKKWKLGFPIGQGGFGEIYEAQEIDSSGASYPYVIKIEPHGNGPLFVEMHFYMRNAKPADVDDFKKEKGLKTFGMPVYLGSGSHEFKDEKYRFVVMEKYGTDLWKIYLENNRIFPADTVFKLGIQILDVLEYIHRRGYVHADIKGANILMGVRKGTTNQIYLVDFGLATKFTAEKEFKPNPKKAHDGTIEYLSRDAHKGVQTRRGDLEILAYNLIQWLGCTLPWEKNLKDPNLVHSSKEEYMSNVPKMIKACFGHKTPPGAIVDYLNYLITLNFNTEPDYKKIRKIFVTGIKDSGAVESGPLIFSVSKKTPQKRKNDLNTSISPKKKIGRGKKLNRNVHEETENIEENTNDEDISELHSDEDIIDESLIEEPVAEKKGLKEKGNQLPKKKGGKQKSLKANKTEEKDENIEQKEIEDPYEGYTAAMKEIVMKKLQKEKSKNQKREKSPVMDDDMEGYTESMKELVSKKKKKLVSKKVVKSQRASGPETNTKNGLPKMTRGNQLRSRKEVCYNDFTDSD